MAESIRRRFRPNAMGFIPEWLDPSFARRVDLHRRHRAIWGLQATGLPRAEGVGDITGPDQQAWNGLFDQAMSLHSLEVRHPFLDARVVEFAFAIPLELFFDPALGSKPLLRRAMQGVLPDQVRTARRKVRFDAIINRGLKERGATTVRRLLRDPTLAKYGYVNAVQLRAAYERFQRTEHAPVWGMWFALAAEVWLNGAIEGAAQCQPRVGRREDLCQSEIREQAGTCG
jgi:asparagine synthase (glutamine-hydrolysing)